MSKLLGTGVVENRYVIDALLEKMYDNNFSEKYQ